MWWWSSVVLVVVVGCVVVVVVVDDAEVHAERISASTTIAEAPAVVRLVGMDITLRVLLT